MKLEVKEINSLTVHSISMIKTTLVAVLPIQSIYSSKPTARIRLTSLQAITAFTLTVYTKIEIVAVAVTAGIK